MPLPITTTDNREMRGVWRHLARDSIRRGWFSLLFWTLYFLMYFAIGATLDLDLEYDDGMIFISALMPAFFMVMSSIAYAVPQYPTYSLLGVLPMSRGTRGKWIWFHHIWVAPIFCYGITGVVALLASVYGLHWEIAAKAVDPVFMSVISVAVASVALPLLIANQPPVWARWQSGILCAAPMVLLFRWGLDHMTENVPFPRPFLYGVAGASILVLAISYVRAPRLVAGPRLKNVRAGRLPRRKIACAPTKRRLLA